MRTKTTRSSAYHPLTISSTISAQGRRHFWIFCWFMTCSLFISKLGVAHRWSEPKLSFWALAISYKGISLYLNFPLIPENLLLNWCRAYKLRYKVFVVILGDFCEDINHICISSPFTVLLPPKYAQEQFFRQFCIIKVFWKVNVWQTFTIILQSMGVTRKIDFLIDLWSGKISFWTNQVDT